ncbi:2-polyprenyl-6-methoxyphenol hydroxylase-like FAD-dependent oxidoreductase [Lentzea atacamensis]|uniref:2-polyprenyl-6-methoxyphenol hydroxylase-like FAD-dependent oxidoreductase n=1 Tax=Lentzea atacamensis TaxID=531938 RepID=A0A316IIG9_9PSEU|nr:FAD-dependent monooxygenase [Lentzea atacamensis]PWK86989.1 2-polyprenyl-6-methoxyphenol hydroxylase-like FAD-dependent oxidoreductase [Lentzea atacamensis]
MRLGTTAVVLGGSAAGLCAAGALSPHFDHVVVLERDELPANAEHRRGVPQSKHPHFLLNSGRRAIGELFPGFEDELIAAGGLHLMPSMDAAYLDGEGWSARKRGSMTMIYGSRLLIERVLRDHVRKLANVVVREGVSVNGLCARDGEINGVNFTSATGDEHVEADLVVDAMGRGSPVASWLVAAGWPEPQVQTLDAKVTYTSRWYELPEKPPASWWWRHLVIMPTQHKGEHPAEHEFLVNFFPIEGNRAIACMGSWGHEMPRTAETFARSARRVRTPLFAAAMDRCTPVSEVHLTRSTGNKWRRYDRWATPPRRLVFVGDSICAFNPFYAQGISSAASSALLLREHLSRAERVDAAFSAQFLAAQRKLLTVPWRLALARDRGYACAGGTEKVSEWKRRLVAAVSGPAFSFIVGAAREYPVVDEHFAKVFNLDESLGDMMTNPRVLAGLLRYRIRTALGRHRIPFGFDPLAEPPATDYSTASAASR